MVKLGARDRAQLVVLAYESGLVRPGWVSGNTKRRRPPPAAAPPAPPRHSRHRPARSRATGPPPRSPRACRGRGDRVDANVAAGVVERRGPRQPDHALASSAREPAAPAPSSRPRLRPIAAWRGARTPSPDRPHGSRSRELTGVPYGPGAVHRDIEAPEGVDRRLTRRSSACGSVTSVWIASARPPAPRIARSASLRADSSAAASVTAAPADASAEAEEMLSRPLPTITATFPARSGPRTGSGEVRSRSLLSPGHRSGDPNAARPLAARHRPRGDPPLRPRM